ncbi:MAG: endonuclease domain-containing protein [Microgenomates group bacterium]
MGNIVDDAIHSERGVVRYWPELKNVARVNRKNPTKAEETLWNVALKDKQTGYLFLRQKPLYRFVADFYCSELSLVIEVDGDSHDNKKGTDRLRDQWLKCIGINTIRFTNDEVLNNMKLVKDKLTPILVKGGVGGGLKR